MLLKIWYFPLLIQIKKKKPRKDIYYLDWLNKCTKDKPDANAKKDKLVNDSGLNEKIKTLATKEDKNISNRNNIKSRTRQNCETLNVWFKLSSC